MIKTLPKLLLFTILICLLSLTSKAQLGYNYAQYDFGVAASINTVYGDAETIKQTPALHLSFNYNQTAFINHIVELQIGKLAGGDSVNTLSGRQFNNHFTAVVFRSQLQAGEFIDYSQSALANAFKNLYISTGIGAIFNNLVDVNRYSIKVPGFYTAGVNQSTNLFLPLRIGYEFKVFNQYDEPTLKIDFAYQYNYVFGDDIDGYRVGSQGDKFLQWSLGFKFAIGGVTSNNKQISY
jgi:hypothetical protein